MVQLTPGKPEVVEVKAARAERAQDFPQASLLQLGREVGVGAKLLPAHG